MEKREMTKRRVTALLLAVLICAPLSLLSCRDEGGDGGDKDGGGAVNTGGTEAAETADPTVDDIPASLSFDGETFNMLTFEEPHANLHHVFDEPSEDTLDNAKYMMISSVEERFKVDITETVQSETYVNTQYRQLIAAGADDYDLAFVYDRFAHYFAEEGLIYDYADLDYIDLDKDYWDQSLREYATVGDKTFYAFGTYDFTYFDMTHCLVFNKDLYRELNFKEDPYELVRSGKWTFDEMAEMMKTATYDNDGDDRQSLRDNYGYVSSGKQILPNFWIAGGTTSVSLDRGRMPYLTMVDNDRFQQILDSCFELFWDQNVWYVSTGMGNQSEHHTELFSGGNALFADYTFFFLSQLRNCEYNFGILPFPKYDAEQNDYYSRVEAGTVLATVPITNPDPEMAGALIEGMASEGYKTILPEYYETSLKRRDSPDEESAEMLDKIFATRVYDLGDSWYCDQIRDGMMVALWNSGKNTFASTYKSYEKMIMRTINETIRAYLE